MGPIYEKMCVNYSWVSDEDALLTELNLQNLTDSLQFDDDMEDARKLGFAAMNEVTFKKIDYASKIGDKDAALSNFILLYFPIIPVSRMLKAHFHMVRIGIFFLDATLMKYHLMAIER